MTRLQTVSDYEREVATLDQLIASNSGSAVDFATELAIAGLTHRRQRLLDELNARSDDDFPGQEINLIFTGAPVLGHTIQTGFMGKMLIETQDLLRAFAENSASTLTKSGRLKVDDKRSTTLHFAGSFRGSFGMRLEALQDEPELDGEFRLAPSFETFVKIVAASARPETAIEALSELGTHATDEFKKFAATIAQADANVSVEWLAKAGRVKAVLKSAAATKIVELIKELNESTEVQWYTGVLDEASSRKGRFGFTTVSGQQFDGVVEDHVRPELHKYFDKTCNAYIQTRTLTHAKFDRVTMSHRLQDLAPDIPGVRSQTEASPYADEKNA